MHAYSYSCFFFAVAEDCMDRSTAVAGALWGASTSRSSRMSRRVGAFTGYKLPT